MMVESWVVAKAYSLVGWKVVVMAGQKDASQVDMMAALMVVC